MWHPIKSLGKAGLKRWHESDLYYLNIVQNHHGTINQAAAGPFKTDGWPILKQAGPFRNRLPAMACFKMGQIKVCFINWADRF